MTNLSSQNLPGEHIDFVIIYIYIKGIVAVGVFVCVYVYVEVQLICSIEYSLSHVNNYIYKMGCV